MNLRSVFRVLGLVLLMGFGYTTTTHAQCIAGATVSTRSGATEIFPCAGDDISGVIAFTTSTQGTPFAYVIVEADGTVIDVSLSNRLDLSQLGQGEFRVYAISFGGNLLVEPGDNIFSDELASLCFELTDNFIPIFNSSSEGGNVSTIDGENEVLVCSGDGVADVLEFSRTSQNSSFTYVITDENNIVLAIPDGNTADFEGAGSGICRVWGLAYVGTLELAVGDDAAAVVQNNPCYDLSDDFVTVIRTFPDGGTVALTGGGTSATVCVNDATADALTFEASTNSSAPYTFVVTDENNIILAIPSGNEVDFDAAPPGICRVWGLSFTGNVLAQVGDDAAAIDLTDECFDLSDNFVEVIRKEVDGNTVSLEDGATDITVCVDDGEADLLSFINGSTSSENYAYVITDENNIILGIPSGNSQDFEGAGQGICRVWGLSFTGNVLAQVGDDAAAIDLTDECFELSENFITVNRVSVDGGTVALEGGGTEISICVNDGESNILSFTNTTNSAANYAFVVTDDQNIIITILDGNSVDFDVAQQGICRVWGLSYTGNVIAQPGDDAAAIDLTDECFDLSDNFVTIDRKAVNGGFVLLDSGESEATVCVDDDESDILVFINDANEDDNYVYVITDENNIIIGVTDGNFQDFEEAGVGICRVWGLAYTGDIIAQPGDDAAAVALSDECFDLSNNFITVNRVMVDGGTVALESGETEISICVNDDESDQLVFTNQTTSSAPYGFLVTNDQNIIITLLIGNSVDFNVVPPGICRIWGLSYTGSFIGQTGDDAAAIDLSDECFALSSNFITVNREGAFGGTVETENGETEVTLCPGDGLPDVVKFDSLNSLGEYAYVITDENNIILDIPDGDMADFDGAGEGICRVWGLAYTGNVTAQVGDDAAAVELSDGCFQLSSNFINIIRSVADGGTVSTNDGKEVVYTCVGDSIPDIIEFTSTDASGDNFTYVITDENNIILGIPPGNSQDFEGAGIGICRVWGLAYSGNIIANVGDDAAAVDLADGCFDLSENFITVNRDVPAAGTISTTNGDTSVVLCVGDGIPDMVPFVVEGASNSRYTFLITDDNNFLLATLEQDSFDFDNAIGGNCRVWGLSHTGEVLLFPGDNISDVVQLASGCFDLTDQYLTLTRIQVDGGLVFANLERDTLYTCPGDGVDDAINLINTSSVSEGSYAFVVTDNNNIILALPDSDSLNFESVPVGVCRIWGVNFTGNLLAQVGDNAAEIAISDGCFALSDNFVTIIRDMPDAGVVSTDDGRTQVRLCIGVENELKFVNTGTSISAYQYVVTDENNVILGLPDGSKVDFSGAGPGTCRVWGLSYTGSLTAGLGDDAAAIALSDDCFQLSENFVEVVRSVEVDGGSVFSLTGDTLVYTCPGDSISDLVVAFTDSQADTSYRFIITDTLNAVIAPDVEGNVIDFDPADPGICRIWGVSFTGDLIVGAEEILTEVSISDDCYDLSDNYITVVRETPEGGSVSTTEDETDVTVFVGDNEPDSLTFKNAGASNSLYAYVITDENNVIIGVADGNSQDFEGAGPGICRVWGLAYTGTITAVTGDDAAAVALTDDCFDLSDNFVTVTRIQSNPGGEVVLAPKTNFEHNNPVIKRVKVSPNPAFETITLEYTLNNGGANNTNIQVFNTNGNQVLFREEMNTNGENRVDWNIVDLPTGMYFVVIRNGSAVNSTTFIKQ